MVGERCHSLSQSVARTLSSEASLPIEVFPLPSKSPFGALHEEYNFLSNRLFYPFYPGMNVIGCNWVYRVKHQADDSLFRCQAREVASGYKKEKLIDFSETFSFLYK